MDTEIRGGFLKNMIILAIAAIGLVGSAVFFPQFFSISKTKSVVRKNRIFIGITFALVVICIAIDGLEIIQDSHTEGYITLTAICLIIFSVGNLVPNVQINSWIGIRLPWVTGNPHIWKETHDFMGQCSFPIAVITAVSGLLFDPEISAVCGLLMWGILPCAYSVYLWKK